MKLIFTSAEGTLKFTSLNQAAAYMKHFNRAASKRSARKNISDALAGQGTGGNHAGGTQMYNRNTAYGFKVEQAK